MDSRRPMDDEDLRHWLDNMLRHHRFTHQEAADATGLSAREIAEAAKRFGIQEGTKPKRGPDAPLLVLPYPGGRHPRTGFLEGAIRPHRETKISVFAPWDDTSYVVVDVPEAIWCDAPGGRELLYLAHTHIPTTWDRKGVALEKLEWRRGPDGLLVMERRLPNGIVFGTRVVPERQAVRLEMWLTNHTDAALTGLSVQNCVMLKGAPEFAAQANDNKIDRKPYTACRSAKGNRWVITAWVPCHRVWANAKCPCMHSDPKFPDSPPGKTQRLRGWLSFYEGADIDAELRRIDGTGWRRDQHPDDDG